VLASGTESGTVCAQELASGARSESVERAAVESEASMPALGALGWPGVVLDDPGAQPAQATPALDESGASQVALPSGAGKVSGMGESFTAELSTGIGSYSIPLRVGGARGAAQPGLTLAYTSSRGHGVAGLGWSLGGVAYVARQTDRGVPGYQDPPNGGGWQPTQDRFVFGAGQELVPICQVSVDCGSRLQPGEMLPASLSGWQYFRSRVEGAWQRFYWSPDRLTWIVESQDGITIELGISQDAPARNVTPGDTGALETDPTASRVFRWNVTRVYDANVLSGSPVNVVQYRYQPHPAGSVANLTDVYDTPPAGGTTTTLVQFAHHVHVRYETRPDARTAYRRGWATLDDQRIHGVDFTAQPAGGGGLQQVKRIWFAYDPSSHVSLLTQLTVEGRCSNVPESQMANTPNPACSLPPTKFTYSHVVPRRSDGTKGVADLSGFDGFDETIHHAGSSPHESLKVGQTQLMDVNGDGLPDVVVTNPASYGGFHGVYFNGSGGQAAAFGTASRMAVQPTSIGTNVSGLTFANPNVSIQDLDGDGVADLLHMPRVKQYEVFSPQLLPGQWTWVGRVITTASSQDPKIDFQANHPQTREMDVNGDGLIDVVYSAGTEYQTFFALGRYPGGDGQFGTATWMPPVNGAPAAQIVNAPVRSCVPWSATPVRFGDPDVQIADMNGDGLPDVVRVRDGDVRYWPGRGDGHWGTGPECAGGTYAANQYVAMTQSPWFPSTADAKVRLEDVNGDGFPDLVRFRANAVDVWLNEDGTTWTASGHVIENTPYSATLEGTARLTDIDGSGSADLLWGNGGDYAYMELLGGGVDAQGNACGTSPNFACAPQPGLLVQVDSSTGSTTQFQYGTSTQQMLAANGGWTYTCPSTPSGQCVTPMPVQVITRKRTLDNASAYGRAAGVYVTTYTYTDPVYDGRQREFRGFKTTKVTSSGDANSPTSETLSRTLLGECLDEVAGDPVDACSASQMWRDNPREALKGLPLTSEQRDPATGRYLSTTHDQYTLRHLYAGLDGREVRHAFAARTDGYLYDTGAPTWVPGSATVTLDVQLEGNPTGNQSSSLTVQSARYAHTATQTLSLDPFGHAATTQTLGCTAGCSDYDPSWVDEVTTTQTSWGVVQGTWGWRALSTSTTGSAHPGQTFAQTTTTYDATGRPTDVTATLQGSLPLDRFHAAGGAVASPPAGASVDGVKLLRHVAYDPYGNPLSVTEPDGRYATATYDATYAIFRVSSTRYAGVVDASGHGPIPLTTTVPPNGFDPGFGVVTQVVDPRGQPSQVAYDAFGRPVAWYRASAASAYTLETVPWMTTAYAMPDATGAPYSYVATTVRTSGPDGAQPDSTTVVFIDSLGRPLATLSPADVGAGDGGNFVVNQSALYDQKGAVRVTYLPWFWSGTDPRTFPPGAAPTAAFSTASYDAFGRTISTTAPGGLPSKTVYHVLGEDHYDAEDLAVGGVHFGTYVSTEKDGYGRDVRSASRYCPQSAQNPPSGCGTPELHQTITTYLPTGRPETVTRRRAGSPDVMRWMRYDSLDRLVLNVEPNTTAGFTTDTSAPASSMKAWRYAYDDAGDLVGTSDPDGCGVNSYFDGAGRPLATDYSPCNASQPSYSPPADLTFASGDGTEVFHRYDTLDPDTTAAGLTIDPLLALGRETSVSDRAQKVLVQYDYLGRITAVAKAVAAPGPPASALASRYAAHWWRTKTTFDSAGRPLVASTGSEFLLASDGTSEVRTTYTLRGLPAAITSSYGTLVSSHTYLADGRAVQAQYGDAAKTLTQMTYDPSTLRLTNVMTSRSAAPMWSSPGASYVPAPSAAYGTEQRLLENTSFVYDAVGNPLAILDQRNAAEWLAGAQPVSRTMTYDDYYRATSVKYSYASGTPDPWTSPYAFEDGGGIDTRRSTPSPHVQFVNRVASQSFAYDWMGNITSSGDDAGGFFDRSLGTEVMGGSGPYQLTGASIQGSPAGARDGSLQIAYDAAGNVTGMSVVRLGPCLPAGGSCTQRFAYDWDETGRLARARRWDGDSSGPAAPIPTATPAADLSYTYDAAGARVRKTAVDAAGKQTHAVFLFPGLALRGATFDPSAFEYVSSQTTEVVELGGLGRVQYDDAAVDGVPGIGGNPLHAAQLHVLLRVKDSLGSGGTLVDLDTGELAESRTYLPFGGTESDYRTGRWNGMRDDNGFTGKEDDLEVGLQYFGARYLVPALGRWLSPDPLAVHGLGADLNVYAYVAGRVYQATDPTGLETTDSNDMGKLIPMPKAGDSSDPYWNTFMDGKYYHRVEDGEKVDPDKPPKGMMVVAIPGAVGADKYQYTPADPDEDAYYAPGPPDRPGDYKLSLRVNVSGRDVTTGSDGKKRAAEPRSDGLIDGGHAFIRFQRQGQSIALGWYPATAVTFPDDVRVGVLGRVQDDSTHVYDFEATWEVNKQQFDAARKTAFGYADFAQPHGYQSKKFGDQRACIDFAVDVLQSGGISVPQTRGTNVFLNKDFPNGIAPGQVASDLSAQGTGTWPHFGSDDSGYRRDDKQLSKTQFKAWAGDLFPNAF
jgi:RHS repeat-associated protein